MLVTNAGLKIKKCTTVIVGNFFMRPYHEMSMGIILGHTYSVISKFHLNYLYLRCPKNGANKEFKTLTIANASCIVSQSITHECPTRTRTQSDPKPLLKNLANAGFSSIWELDHASHSNNDIEWVAVKTTPTNAKLYIILSFDKAPLKLPWNKNGFSMETEAEKSE